MNPILITGARGKLGLEVSKLFPRALIPTREEIDIRDKNKVFGFIDKHRPKIIIHLAAETDIRKCEKYQEEAYEINVKGTENIVLAHKKFTPLGYFIFMSTPCVFSGERGNYSERDIPYPKNFYALTKLLGEFIVNQIERFLIIRGNFVAREKWPYPKAFVDRFGTYLFADDLALAIKDIIDKNLTGLIHIVGKEKISMFELAKITTPDVLPITINEIDIPLTKDMSLISERIPAYEITKKRKTILKNERS